MGRLIVERLLNIRRTTADGPGNKFYKIPYSCNVSVKVGKQLRKYGIRPAYYPKGAIGRFLANNKLDKIGKHHSIPGVCELHCNNCTNCYIGQTGRTFSTRFKEHAYLHNKDIGEKDLSSSFAQHLPNEGHDCDNK